MLFEINKPSPVPLDDFETNFSNSLGNMSESIPEPVSLMLTMTTSLLLLLLLLYCWCCCCWSTISLPFGINSRFNKSRSIDTLPGPVNRRLIEIAINSRSNSYPPAKPLDNLTLSIAPIISIIKRPAVILVNIPTRRAYHQLLLKVLLQERVQLVVLHLQKNLQYLLCLKV